jgi:hypothetical protein
MLRFGNRLSHRLERLLAVSTTVTTALLVPATHVAISAAVTPDFVPPRFTILAIDGSTVIGSSRFKVANEPGGVQLVSSESQFNDGDCDREVDRLVSADRGGGLPRQVSFSHHFYHADDSPDRSISADFLSGKAVCTTYESGHTKVRSATIDFPRDTYAGGSVIIPPRSGLMTSLSKPIAFHYFTCMPGPRVVSVRALPSAPSPWKHYPGRVVQVDLQPDFGWISSVIAAFLPNIRAWFDPARQWFVAGVETARYYRGTKTLLVAEQPSTAGQLNEPH